MNRQPVILIDDGTIDTVIQVGSIWVRFSQEYAAQYRDADGALTEDGFNELVAEALDSLEGE